MSEKIIMAPEDIRRSLTRIAHEIAERNKVIDHLILVGLHTRGVPLAKRLAADIENFEKAQVLVGSLDFRLYRDDLLASEGPAIQHPDIPTDIDDKSIVLVDDVLYTGRSIRAAMDALIALGRPRSIQLAVLVDRGHREMPIKADYVGKNIPSASHDEIQVRLIETDGIDEVAIISPAKDNSGRSKPRQENYLQRSTHGSGK